MRKDEKIDFENELSANCMTWQKKCSELQLRKKIEKDETVSSYYYLLDVISMKKSVWVEQCDQFWTNND